MTSPAETARYVYEFPTGPLPEDHDVFRCFECEGEGGFEIRLPARSTDLEPRYRSTPCEECRGGFVEFAECVGCDREIEAGVDGVGAVERCVETGRASALCGPCGWAECMADD